MRRAARRENVLQKYLFIALGGALGAIARYWVGAAVGSRMGTRFPYGTFIINMSACIIIGFSITLISKRADLNPAWRYMIPIALANLIVTAVVSYWVSRPQAAVYSALPWILHGRFG